MILKLQQLKKYQIIEPVVFFPWTSEARGPLPHPEMRGKVDLTRTLDLILKPTPLMMRWKKNYFFIKLAPV